MHIPENYLSPSTCGVFAVAMVPVWMRAVRHVREEVPRQKMPLVGVAAAFCFLAMMFNIPLPGGTTGHAVAGTLVAILFGPWAATLAISIALAIQAVMFGDGGILALPANCFNMAFVLPMCGYAVYGLVRGREGRHTGARAGSGRPGLGRELAAAGVGSYVGINAAALCAAIEFGVQPLLFSDAAGRALYCPYPLWVSVPAMLVGHLTVWGAAEVVFTVGILAFEGIMFQLLDEDNEIARNATTGGSVALTLHGQLHAVLHSRGNVDGDNLIALHDAVSMAVGAFVLDHATFAATLRTSALGLHYAQDGTLGLGNDTGTMAMGAHLRLAVLGAAAVTGLTRDIFADLDFLLATTVDFLKGKFDLDTKVGSPQHTTCSATTAEAREAGAESATAKQVAKDATKLREDIVHIHAALTIGAFHAGHTELVVAGLLIGIAQHVISLGSLLELLLSLFVTGVTVGMVLQSQLAVSLLQFLGRGILANTQYFIIISLCHNTKLLTLNF